MAKKGKQKRGRNGGVSTTQAPTMNGMQQVERWTLFDLVPVFQQTGTAGVPVVL